jgi:predicted lipoprotein with Yx(FWY)xxD motif
MKLLPLLFFFGLVLALMYICPSAVLFAQWSADPYTNNPISTARYNQIYPTSISDGAGGAIITWQDYRNNSLYSDIYAQRINAEGVLLWATNGISVSKAEDNQNFPTIVGDGTGGAIITWYDYRNNSLYGDIYAQRINAAGVVQWTADGVPISTDANNQMYPTIVSDGVGGAIITWQDDRSGGSNFDIYAQRIDAAGVVQWTIDGVPVSTASNNQMYPTIVSDGVGGAIITWHDYRSGSYSDIYAQRINTSGVVQWTTDGISISAATYNQSFPTIVSDGTQGAIITWEDYRSNSAWDIYAQRINASGMVQWTNNGVPISVASYDQSRPNIVSDGSHGAIITWEDYRSNSAWDIYGQRINTSGVVQWTTDGVPISTVNGDQSYPTIVSDDVGGAIITWEDGRSNSRDVYAQRINASGVVQWTTDGVPISKANNNQNNPIIVSDGACGAIITWKDYRSDITYPDLYAQNIDRNGYIGDARPHIQAIRDVKNDQGGKITAMWNPSSLDVLPNQTIYIYTIYRGVKPSAAQSSYAVLGPEEYQHQEIKNGKMSHVYMRLPLSTNSTETIYWENIATVSAEWLDGYSYNVPTLSDSGLQGNPLYYVMIRAKTYTPTVYWDSPPDSGFSVDNLSPSAVTAVAAQVEKGPSVNIHWSEDTDDPDVGYYEVHRSSIDGFTPSSSTLMGQTTDTILTDGSPISGAENYYRIITVDVHGNKSNPSSQASVGILTTAEYKVSGNWNMISVPIIVNDYTKMVLYPSAISDAFFYQTKYITASILDNGKGYWLKFDGDQTITMSGMLCTQATIDVTEGWNMIGSISSPVAVANITSDPSGIITSHLFGYNGTYTTISTVEPGKAYWVKVNQSGKLTLSSLTSEVNTLNRIRIVPTAEQPPPSPDDMAELGVPAEYTLNQNYPNPFNPNTRIEYALPTTGHVTLSVFNILGQEVVMLVDEEENAGYKSVAFDASNLPSGIYTYRLTSGTFTQVKKMILLR